MKLYRCSNPDCGHVINEADLITVTNDMWRTPTDDCCCPHCQDLALEIDDRRSCLKTGESTVSKNKLLYVTPEQQQWLADLVRDRIKNPQDTDDIVLAAAFIKKLRGRQEKGTNK